MALRKKRYFSFEEAERLLKRRFRSRVDFSGVPKGTTGTAVRMDEGPRDSYSIGIEWDLTGRERPLVDWFSADEIDDFLEEA